MAGLRLSPLDIAFLSVESPSAHMHVGWAAVFEPPEQRTRPSFEELRAHIAARLPRAPRYRQMLRSLPLGLGAPAWVDDPRFDISRQVVAAESSDLGQVIDRCMSAPLARDRPLWQICVVPRLDDGRVGIVGKAHHCMVDGIAAVELASLLLDPDPDPPPPRADSWAPDHGPGLLDLVLGGAVELGRRQLGLATLPARVASSPQRAAETLGKARRAAYALADAVRPAPGATPLNPSISPQRHLGMLQRPLEELLRIKHAFGVKLNDVVLAVAAGGVRGYLGERGDGPQRLKTMVPVSVRAPGEEEALGNRISFMFVDLPCEEPDAVRRLRVLHAATRERKQREEPEGADTVLRLLGLTPAPVQRLASRFVASPRAFNLVVSNIPGPRETLYMAGCRLAGAYPVVPIADRHALSIGMTTVGEEAFFGLYADRRSLPDVDDLAARMGEEIDVLLERAARRRFTSRPGVPVGAD